MTFSTTLNEAPLPVQQRFLAALHDYCNGKESVYVSVILAAGDAGLSRQVAFRAMSDAYAQGLPLSQALGWPWLRRWEIDGDILTGMRTHDLAASES